MSYKINFLELLVNVGVNIPLDEAFKISPYARAYGGYTLDGKFKRADITTDIYTNDSEEDILNEKCFDYGANLGLGFIFGNKMVPSAPYSHRLVNLLDDTDVKVNTCALSAGLTFLL